MSLDRRLLDIQETQSQLAAMQEELRGSSFGGGSGGGKSGGMDERVSRLEGQFDKLRDDNVLLRDRIGDVRHDLSVRIASVEGELGKLSVKVDHLPSKGFIVTVLSIAVAILVGVATFAEKLQALIP